MTITPYDSAPLTEAETADLSHLEGVIEQGLQTFYMTGAALATIRDTRLYRLTHGTFEDYCEDRWNLKRRAAYRLIEAAGVVENVSNWTQTLPTNEAQTRPLAQLPAAQQPEVWQEAVETAPAGKITAAHVERTVERFRRVERQPAPYDLTENDSEPEHETPTPTPIRAIVPDAVIGPPQDISFAFQGGDVRRSNLSRRFNKAIGPFLDSGAVDADLITVVTPEEMAGLLDESDLLQESAVVPLAKWVLAVYDAYHTAPAIRRIK